MPRRITTATATAAAAAAFCFTFAHSFTFALACKRKLITCCVLRCRGFLIFLMQADEFIDSRIMVN